MKTRTLKGASTLVMLGSTLLFVVVLLLDWHRTTVEIAGVTNIRADEVGLVGWGWLAGAAAVTLLALNLNRMRRGLAPDPAFGVVDLVLGVAMVCATVAAVFAGDTQVQVAVVGVETGTTLWPAWIGVGLAVVTAIAAAVVAVPEAWEPGRRATATAA